MACGEPRLSIEAIRLWKASEMRTWLKVE